MISQPSDTLQLLKSRFICESLGVYGFFYIQIDPSTNQIEKFDVLASHFRAFIDELIPEKTWTNCPWSVLEDMIDLAKYKGELAENYTKDIRTSIEQILIASEIKILSPLIKRKAIDQLDMKFNQLLRKSFDNNPVDFNFRTTEITRDELEQKIEAKKELFEQEQEILDVKAADFEKLKGKIPVDSAIVQCSFVLSPVQGIPIGDLKVGDQIMVRIKTDDPKGRYFIEMLDILRGDKILPIPSVVDQVKKGPAGEYYIITKIQEGIYGRIDETEQVKIKRFNPDKDTPLKTVPVPESEQKSGKNKIDHSKTMEAKDKLTFIFLGVALLILVIIALLYILD